MRGLVSALFVIAVLLGAHSLVQAQVPPHWRPGTATLVNSQDGTVLNGSEISYEFKVVLGYQHVTPPQAVGGLQVKANKVEPTPSNGEIKVGEPMRLEILNAYLRGMKKADMSPAYRMDWIEFQILRKDTEAVLYEARFVGAPATAGELKFDTSLERTLVPFPWKVESATSDLKVNVKVGVSPRRNPRYELDFSRIGGVPGSLKYVYADSEPEGVKTKLKDYVDGTKVKVWEGAVIGYNIKDGDSYKPSSATPLPLIPNALNGYRTWLVTGDAVFENGTFTPKRISYTSPVNGFNLKVEYKDATSSYKVIESGGTVIEGAFIRVTFTPVDASSCNSVKEMGIGYPKPMTVPANEVSTRSFVAEFAISDNVNSLTPVVGSRQYTVFYDKENPGPDCKIDYVKDNAQDGPVVANGGSIECGHDLFVKFTINGTGKSITKATAIATDGSKIELQLVDAANLVYKAPAAEMRNISRIVCSTGQVKYIVKYEVSPFGTLTVTSDGNPVVSGATEIDAGKKIKVSVENLQGDVVPADITLVYKGGAQESHPNTKSFEIPLQNNVEQILVTFIPHTITNQAADDLNLVLEAGYIVDGNMAKKSETPGVEIIAGKDRVLAGTKIKVLRKGGQFPEDTFIKIAGGEPASISAEGAAWSEATVKIVGDATITLEKGRAYHKVEFNAPTEGQFELRSVGTTHVKKPAKEEIGDNQPIASTWRVVDGARLKVVETTAPASKKLVHYKVTIGGKEQELKNGEEFTLSGPITSIVPLYVRACKVVYTPTATGYSAIEVKDGQGNPIAVGETVKEGERITVKVTPAANYYCKEVKFNSVSTPYNKTNGADHTVQDDVMITPVMEELHYFSLQWQKIDGINMTVRLGSMTGKEVPAGEKIENLEQGTRVYVTASQSGHYYAGLRVNNDQEPYQLEDAGNWYSFALNVDITAITPVMKPIEKPTPGTGKVIVFYAYDHAEVRIQRMEGGKRVPVPQRSLVPENTELYITIRNIVDGFRFTCIVVNQRVVHVQDESEYVVTAAEGNGREGVCSIAVKIDKPTNVPPKFIVVRKAQHGKLRVVRKRGTQEREIEPIDDKASVDKKDEVLPGDTFSATLVPDEGYEKGPSVFDGEDVELKDDGTIEFKAAASQRALLLLWASFKAKVPKPTLTWETNGEGKVEVRNEEGELLGPGVSLRQYEKVTVSITVDEKHHIEKFTVNGLTAGTADEFKGGKFTKTIEMDKDKAMLIVFAPNVDPTPKPNDPSTEVTAAYLADVLVYPQPMQSQLNIRHAESAARYWLLDVMGRHLQAGNLSGASEQVLNVEHLGQGIYLLVLEDMAGNRRTFRVVK